jgi:hypothetical protein
VWGERRDVYRVLVGKREGRQPLERPRRRWDYDFELNLREVGRTSMDWIDLAQDRENWRAVVNAVMNLRIPKNAGNFLINLGSLS